MMKRLVWGLVFVGLSGAPLSAKMVDPIRSGNWKGGAFLNDKTGKFVSCMASGQYRSGIVLSIGMLRSRAFLLGFANKDWRFGPGSFVVRGKIDENRWTRLTVRTLSDGKGFSLLLNRQAKRILRAGRVLKIEAGGKVHSFNLTGTAVLIDALEDCVDRRLALEAGTRAKDRGEPDLPTRNAPQGAPGAASPGSGDGAVAGARAPGPAAPAARALQPPPATRNAAVEDDGEAAPAPGTRKRKKLSTGTGFFVTGAGHFVTNRHVVAGCRSIRIAYPGEKYHDASVISLARADDLAVLKTTLKPRSFATFRSGERPRLGDSVVVFGFPYYGVLATSGNLATGNISALAGLSNRTSQYQISAPMQPGNSGGPVLGSGGNVIAVAQSKLNAMKIARATGDIPQNINFAIKGSVVLEFLESRDVGYQTAAPGAPLAVSEIAARAKKFTIIVRCSR